MVETVGELAVRISADTTPLEQGLSKARQQAEHFAGSSNRAVVAAGSFNRTLQTTAVQSNAVASGFGKMTSAAAPLQQHLTSVAASLTNMVRGYLALASAQTAFSLVKGYAEEQRQIALLRSQFKLLGVDVDAAMQDLNAFNATLQESTGLDDDVIRTAESIGLRFGLLGKDLQAVTRLAANFAVIAGEDLPQAMLTLARITDEPALALTRLKRVLPIDAETTRLVKAFDAVGNRSAAANTLLNALRGSLEGLATSTNTGVTRSLRDLNNTLDDLGKTLAGAFVGPRMLAFLQEFNRRLVTTGREIGLIVDGLQALQDWFSGTKAPVRLFSDDPATVEELADALERIHQQRLASHPIKLDLPATEDVAALKDAADAAQKYADALAQVTKERDTLWLSPAAKAAADAAENAFGRDWQQHLDGTIARMAALNEKLSEAYDLTRSFAGEFVHGILDGKSAVDSLSDALKSLESRIVDMALDAVVKGFFSMLSGGASGGNIFTSLLSGGSTTKSGGMFQHGGVVGSTPVRQYRGGKLAYDEYPAILHVGERVVPVGGDANTKPQMSGRAMLEMFGGVPKFAGGWGSFGSTAAAMAGAYTPGDTGRGGTGGKWGFVGGAGGSGAYTYTGGRSGGGSGTISAGRSRGGTGTRVVSTPRVVSVPRAVTAAQAFKGVIAGASLLSENPPRLFTAPRKTTTSIVSPTYYFVPKSTLDPKITHPGPVTRTDVIPQRTQKTEERRYDVPNWVYSTPYKSYSVPRDVFAGTTAGISVTHHRATPTSGQRDTGGPGQVPLLRSYTRGTFVTAGRSAIDTVPARTADTTATRTADTTATQTYPIFTPDVADQLARRTADTRATRTRDDTAPQVTRAGSGLSLADASRAASGLQGYRPGRSQNVELAPGSEFGNRNYADPARALRELGQRSGPYLSYGNLVTASRPTVATRRSPDTVPESVTDDVAVRTPRSRDTRPVQPEDTIPFPTEDTDARVAAYTAAKRSVTDTASRITDTKTIRAVPTTIPSKFIADPVLAGQSGLRSLVYATTAMETLANRMSYARPATRKDSRASGGSTVGGSGQPYGGAGGVTPFDSGFGGAYRSYAQGGYVGSTPAPLRMVDLSIFKAIPRLHDGLRSSEFPAILKAGERVIPAGGGESKESKISITINNNSTGAQVSASQAEDPLGGIRIDVLIDDLVSNKMRDGGSKISKTLAGMGSRAAPIRR